MSKRGRLELIIGSMFGGKTTLLIERMRKLGGTIVRHSQDTRYGPEDRFIHTHDGDTYRQTFSVSSVEELVGWFKRYRFDTLGIDELHFYETHPILSAVEDMLVEGITVVAAGLEFDHLGIPLRATAALLPIADSITILRGRCRYCDHVAPYQRCITNKVVNGGLKDFELVCAHHLRNPNERKDFATGS